MQRRIGNRRTTELVAETRIQRKQEPATGPDPGSRGKSVDAGGSAPPAAPATSSPPPAAPDSPPAPPPGKGSGPSQTEHVPGHDFKPSHGEFDTSSSDAILQSLAATPPSALGPALAKAQAAKAGVQARERSDLEASFPTIEKPTGLPSRQRPGRGKREGKAAKGEAPEPETGGDGQGETYETAADVAEGPLPASGVRAAIAEQTSDDEGSWWDWLINRIRGFLSQIATTDPGLSTSAGERPRVDLSGAADPSQVTQHEQQSAAVVGQKQRDADQATTADFGENNIAPDVNSETLRPNYRPGAPKPSAGPGRSASTSAVFDRTVGPSVHEQIQGENQKYGEARSRFQTESAEVREESSRRIAEENSRARTEQIAIRQQTREQVDAARQEWRAGNARVAQDFSDGAQARRKDTEKQIETKVHETERRADDELTKAEGEAEKERVAAEKAAAEAKRKAEDKPRSWWERFKGAVSSAFSAIRDAVNSIFEAVRAKVRQLIQAAKRLVRGLIEAARAAITGLIRAFGEALKGLVSIALAAFPEAAERARKWIDDRVSGAVEAVNRTAEALKQAADEALDWLGEQLDKLLAKVQAVFDSILAVVAAIVDLLLRLDEIWAQVVAKLREAAPVPSDVEGVLRFFEELRDSIQAPAATPQAAGTTAPRSNVVQRSPDPNDDYGTDNKGGAGGCGVCYGPEGLKDAGNEAHRLIQAEFETKMLLAGLEPVIEFVLPGVRPDLAFFRGPRRLEIGEIKPDNQRGIDEGRGKLDRAFPAARAQFPDRVVGPLGVPIDSPLLFPTRSTTPGCQTQALIVKPPNNGLYLYYCEPSFRQIRGHCRCDGSEVPVPYPVPKEVVESMWERFKRFMREHEKELALATIAACVIALVALLLPEPVVTKIIAALSALTAAVAFIALWVKFRNYDDRNNQGQA